jgi:hypothetical protein
MPDVPIRLAVLWTALMLTYLLGDVLRIFAGDFRAGEIGGMRASPAIWLAAAAIMLVPIVMLVVSVTIVRQRHPHPPAGKDPSGGHGLTRRVRAAGRSASRLRQRRHCA